MDDPKINETFMPTTRRKLSVQVSQSTVLIDKRRLKHINQNYTVSCLMSPLLFTLCVQQILKKNEGILLPRFDSPVNEAALKKHLN